MPIKKPTQRTEQQDQVHQDERLDRIETFLYYGNGDSLKAWMGIMSIKMDDVKTEVAKIEPLKESVELHHAEPHLWDMIKAPGFIPKFIGIVFTGFILFHTIATYLPNAWNWAVLVLGFPHLVIPLQ